MTTNTIDFPPVSSIFRRQMQLRQFHDPDESLKMDGLVIPRS